MKIKSLLLATAVVVVATGGALAQQNGTATNTRSGSTRAEPEAGSNASAPTRKDSQNIEMQKDKSPASTNAGISQDK
jgi:hypothetical protein